MSAEQQADTALVEALRRRTTHLAERVEELERRVETLESIADVALAQSSEGGDAG